MPFIGFLLLCSDTSDDSDRNLHRYDAADERTSLLPPSGISSNEHYDRKYRDSGRRASVGQSGSSSTLRSDITESSRATQRTDNTTDAVSGYQVRILLSAVCCNGLSPE